MDIYDYVYTYIYIYLHIYHSESTKKTADCSWQKCEEDLFAIAARKTNTVTTYCIYPLVMKHGWIPASISLKNLPSALNSTKAQLDFPAVWWHQRVPRNLFFFKRIHMSLPLAFRTHQWNPISGRGACSPLLSSWVDLNLGNSSILRKIRGVHPSIMRIDQAKSL